MRTGDCALQCEDAEGQRVGSVRAGPEPERGLHLPQHAQCDHRVGQVQCAQEAGSEPEPGHCLPDDPGGATPSGKQCLIWFV